MRFVCFGNLPRKAASGISRMYGIPVSSMTHSIDWLVRYGSGVVIRAERLWPAPDPSDEGLGESRESSRRGEPVVRGLAVEHTWSEKLV